ncbi:hypothetical protein [Jeotgalibacillus soli]|uniref:Uncharacterized protein n=1 Tax=Jeotgalibacillus soli TaxID=889306 RepID=A0A0C2VYR9_9BACL|nr:hypothetical protein [Jeotgalibacillus soli]KIL49521.1 hypothetical protein KP78_09890 [Jeotgalibacillus soli]
MYPAHEEKLGLSICGFILFLFVPCLATAELANPLDNAAFNRYLAMFIVASILCAVTAILPIVALLSLTKEVY